MGMEIQLDQQLKNKVEFSTLKPFKSICSRTVLD